MPLITTFYAGLLGLLALSLAWLVVTNRRRAQVGLGSGGDAALERAIRVHGNFTEYAPLVLILLGLAELSGAPVWLLHASGAVFVAARVAHALGLSARSGISRGRFFGTLATWLVLLVLAVTDVWLGVAALAAA
ncbi:MAG: MAPEG family protein [Gammaproteobacteria bacterium]